MFKRILCLMVVTALVSSCNKKIKSSIREATQQIINTDNSFSDMSKAHGMKKAFLEYIDNEGVLLRPGHMPIIGADAIDYLSQTNDSSFTLIWKPQSAMVASSCDFGFSYGVYTLAVSDTTIHGTYVSIWKMDRDGKWKFVLDTGNEGTEINKY